MNKIYKAVLAAAVVTVAASALIAPASVFAWGDSSNGRPSYTIADINAGKLGDKIVFNSISDSKIGDEKNFVAAKLTSAGTQEFSAPFTGPTTRTETITPKYANINNTWSANTINVKDGDVLTVRLYVHNNSPKGTEKIAEGVSAYFSIPTTVAKKHTIVGYLNSTNATPNRYWDEVVLNSGEDFYVEYVYGSAKYTNAKLGTVALPDSIITSSATLGYDKLDGRIPGCYDYDGVATIQVKVHKSVSAKLAKTVRIKGTKTWSESVNAKVGQEVEYQIEYKNLLNTQVDNVVIRDALPTNVEYVANSTYLYNSVYKDGVLLKDNTLTTTGINIGSYVSKGNAYVRFTGKVVDKTLECGKNKLVNWAQSTAAGRDERDDAIVMVDKTCTPPDDPDDPDDPTDPEDPDKPEDPTDPMPKTGASEIVISALGLGSTVTAGGYYIASRKKLM